MSEQIRIYESQPSDEFTFAPENGDGETIPEFDHTSPEAYPGCLVSAMKEANRGNDAMRGEVMSTVLASKRSAILMACGKCGIPMIRDRGVIYGARACPDVQKGLKTLGELS